MTNLVTTFYFMIYLVSYKPFINSEINTFQVINQFFILILIYHHLLFTDIVSSPEIKLTAGWSFILFSIINFFWPNFFLLLRHQWPGVKALFKKTKVPTKEEKRIEIYVRKCEEKRKEFLKNNAIIKDEFNVPEEEEEMAVEHPRRN